MPYGIGLIGLGKIARAQHVPAIAADARFRLAATADPAGGEVAGAPAFASLEAMLAAEAAGEIAIAAVAVCTPPQARQAIAAAAIRAGKHVLLEKPPGATVAEVEALARLAEAAGVSLFTAWHSCHAAGIARAASWLERRALRSVEVVWREDVRVWHPGQQWIWRAGGFGVFDPGSNALSILCLLLPAPLTVAQAAFSIPANCAEPIAATLRLSAGGGVGVTVALDFRFEGAPQWDIVLRARDGGVLTLGQGGNAMWLDGSAVTLPPEAEYRSVYDRFAALIGGGGCAVESGPLRLIEQAYRCASRVEVEPFHDR